MTETVDFSLPYGACLKAVSAACGSGRVVEAELKPLLSPQAALTGTPAALREELGTLGLGDVTVHELAPGGTL